MKLPLLSTGIVVIAQAHNPTILHPAFLKAQGVVPPDWEPSEPPVCTPAISVVTYPNRITFTADISKFQVLDNAPGGKSQIPELATNYVGLLPHVHYTAVGINIASLVERDEPEKWIIERFLKPGPWNEGQFQLEAVEFRFVYPVDHGLLHLKCSVGSVVGATGEPEKPCVMIDGNYHVNISPKNALEETESVIAMFSSRLEHFGSIAECVFEAKV